MKYFVGIDPGRHTGFAVWCRKSGGFVMLAELDFWDAVETIAHYAAEGEVVCIIEDPNQNRPLFMKGGLEREKAKQKAAQDVGRNKEQAFLLIEYCKRHDIEVRPVKPMNRKLNAADFQAITKDKSRINQHVRDAGMLCYGY